MSDPMKFIKGRIWGGACNLPYCSNKRAVFFNPITSRYVCETCAETVNEMAIKRGSPPPCEEVFGQLDRDAVDTIGRLYRRKLI